MRPLAAKPCVGHPQVLEVQERATRWYLIYSEADFEVFRPAGATRCTDGIEIWHGGGDRSAKFQPNRCNDKGVGLQKLTFLLRFDQYVEYKRPVEAYPLRDIHKICRVCTPFEDALGVKSWLDLLEGLWSYWGFKLRGSGYPKLSAPLAAKLCVRSQTFFRYKNVLGVLYHRAKFGGARISPAASVTKNVDFFCLFVCLSVCSSHF